MLDAASKLDFSNLLSADFFRFTGREISQTECLKLFFLNRCYRFQLWLRLTSRYMNKPLFGFLLRGILRYMQHSYGFQISARTKIGKGFIIGHYGTIVISHSSVIGQNCNVTHGVTIGGAGRTQPKGHPTIGNNVWIGTNSVVVGGITVGDDVMIAPNTFVNSDIPPHSLVIGNPCRIVAKKHATKGYINNIRPD